MSAANPAGETWTVARLLGWTQDYLRKAGRESPRLCAEILLAHAMNCERIRLYTQFEKVPDEAVLGPFRALVKQAAAGHPIAYLTGTKEFFSLTFDVTPDVLIPRPETEVLVERVIDLTKRRESGSPLEILDVGTGSGCIAISLARHVPAACITATDVSPAALAVAQRNAARLNVAERIEFLAGDLFAPFAGGEPPRTWDVIVSNPPYIATEGAPVADDVRNFEPHVALFAGQDGLAVIRRLVAETPRYLRAGGHLLLEVAFDQAAAVRALLDPTHWEAAGTFRDGAGHERVVHARRRAAGCAQVA